MVLVRVYETADGLFVDHPCSGLTRIFIQSILSIFNLSINIVERRVKKEIFRGFTNISYEMIFYNVMHKNNVRH